MAAGARRRVAGTLAAMLMTIAASERNYSPDKPNEDAYAVRQGPRRAVFIVADGVTRSRAADGRYPHPSGSALAAELVAGTLAAALCGPDGDPDLRRAFALANRAVGEVNQRHGVVQRLDYVEHDLWGAVATAVVVQDGAAHWGHIGDTVLLHLPASGGVRACTPDQVAAASRRLDGMAAPKLAAAGGREPYARRFLRNHPDVADSYGVLTGEPAAEAYVVTGSLALQPGDRLALLSDGLGSLRDTAGASPFAPFEPLLRGILAPATLRNLIAAAADADARVGARSDDKTVVLADLW